MFSFECIPKLSITEKVKYIVIALCFQPITNEDHYEKHNPVNTENMDDFCRETIMPYSYSQKEERGHKGRQR